MRTLVIGDIHGCLDSLKSLIESVELKESDLLITLGDYIDRGENSKGVIDYLIELKKSYNVITLKGNHEELLEQACKTRMDRLVWNNVGGLSTLVSYGITNPNHIPKEHWDFLDECEMYYETDTHIFVHGGLEPDEPVDEQDDEALLWLRVRDVKPHMSGKIIVCGHTPQRNHSILNLSYAICVDTHAYAEGWLSCLEVETGIYWQANEKGEVRQKEIANSL